MKHAVVSQTQPTHSPELFNHSEQSIPCCALHAFIWSQLCIDPLVVGELLVSRFRCSSCNPHFAKSGNRPLRKVYEKQTPKQLLAAQVACFQLHLSRFCRELLIVYEASRGLHVGALGSPISTKQSHRYGYLLHALCATVCFSPHANLTNGGSDDTLTRTGHNTASLSPHEVALLQYCTT